MKKFLIYTIALTVSLIYLSSCNDDDMTSGSIYDTTLAEEPLNYVEQWLLDSFVIPYNIEVIYRWDDYETDMSKEATAPHEDTIIPFMKVVRKVWIDVYEQLASVPEEGIAGGDVMRPIFPKQFVLIGSEIFNDDGSKTQGAAEGGRKILLNGLDLFNPEDLITMDQGRALNEDNFIHTLHHEFGHILHQKKMFSIAFGEITPTEYTAQWTSESRASARTKGFVSNYAMATTEEDFVETLSIYIINTPENWNAYFGAPDKPNPTTYELLIRQKLGLLRTYMLENWGIDIDVLRDLTLKAINDVQNGNY